MNQIKFSHAYYKLDNIAEQYKNENNTPKLCKTAILLEVFTKNSPDLHSAFVEYDTTYFDGKQIESYKLPTGPLLILLFKDWKGNLFTTVRSRWGRHESVNMKSNSKGVTIKSKTTPVDKYLYYSSKRGEEFEIVFVEEK